MKPILNLLLSVFLVSCTTTGVPATPVVVVNTRIIPTNTIAPSPTAVPSLTPMITPTLEAPCDPSSVDFCVSDGHFILRRPIRPPANDLIDPVYGYASTANGTREPHHGVEFSNPSGTPVYAAAEGTVLFAAPDEKPVYAPWSNFYGNLVVIQHQDRLFTLYAHLFKIDVQAGQQVSEGEKIGEVGTTGGALGSHLHFEVRQGDVEDYFATQNPVLWLVPAQDQSGNLFGALMVAVVDGGGNLVKKANFTIGYYSDPTQAPVKMYYVTSYSTDMRNGEENLGLGELSAGHYRIVVETNGQISERWVEVESGKLTHAIFIFNE